MSILQRRKPRETDLNQGHIASKVGLDAVCDNGRTLPFGFLPYIAFLVIKVKNRDKIKSVKSKHSNKHVSFKF